MKAYAIKDPKGRIYPWHITFYAKDTKKEFIRWCMNYTWKELYKMGYRCVPVEITEIKK